MLLRNMSSNQDEILEAYSPDLQNELKTLAKESGTPLNSHLLIKLIACAEQISRSPLPSLPLEIALVEHCESK